MRPRRRGPEPSREREGEQHMRGIVTAAERLAELFADREPAEVALMFRKAAEIADRRRPMQVRSTTIRTTAARRLDALFG